MGKVYKNILLTSLAVTFIITIFCSKKIIAQEQSCKSCHKKVFEKRYSYSHEPFIKQQCNVCHLNESDESSEVAPLELIYKELNKIDINHQIKLNNLADDTDYSFRLRAKDTNGKIIYSEIYSFKTKSINPKSIPSTIKSPDSIPPEISSIRLKKIKKGIFNQVTISWKTNEPSKSQIIYGFNSKYEYSTPLEIRFITEHEIILNNISFEKDIHFQIRSEDKNGNLATSEDQVFNIKNLSANNQPPVINNLKIKHLSSKMIKTTFQTDNYAATSIELGQDSNFNLFSYLDSEYTQKHEIDIPSLLPSSHYLLRISASDLNGYKTTIKKDFTTMPDKEGPVISDINITNLTPWKSEIEWLTDEESDSQIYYSTDLSYKLRSSLDPAMKKLHRITLPELIPASTYHFKVRSKDRYGNPSISSINIFITPSNNINYAFDINGIQIDPLNDKSVLIQCQTSQMSRLSCEYELSGKFQEIISEHEVKSKHGSYGLKNLQQSGMDSCSQCHSPSDLGLSHPVGIYAQGKKTQIPKDLPTGKDGMILCITCHNPHGADKKYMSRLVISKDLCIACHKDFKF